MLYNEDKDLIEYLCKEENEEEFYYYIDICKKKRMLEIIEIILIEYEIALTKGKKRAIIRRFKEYKTERIRIKLAKIRDIIIKCKKKKLKKFTIFSKKIVD